MKISGYQNLNSSFLRSKTYQSAKGFQLQNTGTPGLPADRDTVTVSLFGLGNSNRLKSLMEQKQSLLERKNELLNSALESGRSAGSIRDMLDSYEEQMKELERQISQEIAGQNERQPDKIQPSKDRFKPKTKQEIEQEKISDLTALTSGLSQARTVQSAQTQAEGEARVLESEIKMDRGRGGDSEILARKEEKLAMIQQRASQLTWKAVEMMAEVSERIDENREEEEQVKRELSKEGDMSTDLSRESIYASREEAGDVFVPYEGAGNQD